MMTNSPTGGSILKRTSSGLTPTLTSHPANLVTMLDAAVVVHCAVDLLINTTMLTTLHVGTASVPTCCHVLEPSPGDTTSITSLHLTIPSTGRMTSSAVPPGSGTLSGPRAVGGVVLRVV